MCWIQFLTPQTHDVETMSCVYGEWRTWRGLQLYLKVTPAQVFSCEFCETFKETFVINSFEGLFLWCQLVLKKFIPRKLEDFFPCSFLRLGAFSLKTFKWFLFCDIALYVRVRYWQNYYLKHSIIRIHLKEILI